jgi:tellurium resistance protein terC family protein
MLAMDLGVFNKKAHEISNREALITSIIWISLAMAFSGLI